MPYFNTRVIINETSIKAKSKTTQEKLLKNLFIGSLPHLKVIANPFLSRRGYLKITRRTGVSPVYSVIAFVESVATSSLIILLPYPNFTLLIILLNLFINNYLFYILYSTKLFKNPLFFKIIIKKYYN